MFYFVVLSISDNFNISDIDECKESNKCQQNCTNIDGSFQCTCATGYALENDGISCKGKLFTL